jgi:hypothetical protein
MKALNTPSGKQFRYKGSLDQEIIVYPSDRDGNSQDKFALVITPYTINLIKSAIRSKGEILMGASRDNPPEGSLGHILKQEKQTPQQLSYLIPLLKEMGFCDYTKEGHAFVIKHREG